MTRTLFIFTDGGARGNPGPAGLGIVIKEGEKTISEQGKFVGTKTNNEAEYEAFLESLEMLAQIFSEESSQIGTVTNRVEWKLDSMLVVEQLNKHWKIKEPRIQVYAQKAWELLKAIPVSYSISHIPRAQNKEADALVNQALDAAS